MSMCLPTIESIRAVDGKLRIGIATGAWIVSGLEWRCEAIRSWRCAPDFASVNWHHRLVGSAGAAGPSIEGLKVDTQQQCASGVRRSLDRVRCPGGGPQRLRCLDTARRRAGRLDVGHVRPRPPGPGVCSRAHP
jgi:hypothetical protein